VLTFLADENFDGRIVRGLLLREPELDIVRVQDVGLLKSADESILAWAAEHGRVVLTHDVNTMSDFAFQRVFAGLPMPGICEVPKWLGIGRAVDDLLLLAACSEPGDLDSQVQYLPI
jgi:hypothetical protein